MLIVYRERFGNFEEVGQVCSKLDELLTTFPNVLQKSIETIKDQGFPQPEEVGKRIMDSFIVRRDYLAKH